MSTIAATSSEHALINYLLPKPISKDLILPHEIPRPSKILGAGFARNGKKRNRLRVESASKMRYISCMATISKEELRHLADLARIKIDPKEEDKLIKDLGSILGHFEELQELDTTTVAPMTGGTDLKNVFRNDTERESTNRGAGLEAFPESKNGFLKIPPVFE
jgi:aspartyl-tRNA(Asn)/glutamyl-tRNA(Gln) amidotransferase subunit C